MVKYNKEKCREIKMMKYYLALLLGSQLDMGTLYLAFILFVFVQKLLYKDGSFSKIQWQYLGLFILGVILVLFYMLGNDSAYADMPSITLNIRKYFIEIIFSIAMYEYLKYKDLDYLIEMVFISIIMNVLIGTYQIATTFPERINMLFTEPSAAGYYYLFVFFILFEKFKKSELYFYTSRYFMFIGLAIGSKAQIILLALVAALRYAAPLQFIVFFSFLGGLTYLFWDNLMEIDVVEYNIRVLQIYWDDGLSGLRTDNGIWGTYVTRISAIQGALMCIIEHPFGIGFGGFHSWFLENMGSMGFKSSETDRILSGVAYATPKSNLLNFFVVTGVFGILLYISWLKEFYSIRKKYIYLFQSFILLTFASLFIELNPMFMYIMFLFLMKEKEMEINGE